MFYREKSMLTKKIRTIQVEDREIPMICTFNVLEQLQEEYGTIQNFQQKALGLVDSGEKDGNGATVWKSGTIHIKSVLTAATLMINEGIAVTEQGEPVTREDVGMLLRAAGLSIAEASSLVIESLIECIEPKKGEAAQGRRTMKTQQSTLRGSCISERLFSIIRKKR